MLEFGFYLVLFVENKSFVPRIFLTKELHLAREKIKDIFLSHGFDDIKDDELNPNYSAALSDGYISFQIVRQT